MVYFLSGYRPLAPGDLKFKDENKDGKITDGAWTLEDHGDYKIIGNSRDSLYIWFIGQCTVGMDSISACLPRSRK